jgi:UDP-N-acetylglucosamine acyltransferase
MSIHPTAAIEPGAELGCAVDIGPYAVIEANVRLGDRCVVGPHVHLSGHTTIGAGTRIHAGAVVGDRPQDLHYDGAVSYTDIGENCTLREYVTVHRGSVADTRTVVGGNVMLMAFAHLGHNCRIADQVVIANSTLLAGHVEVGQRAFISAGVMIHQFVRVGRLAMIGGGNAIGQDIPPFCMLQFEQIQGPNMVGLRRSGMDENARSAVRNAIKIYFFSGLNRTNAIEEIRRSISACAEVEEFITFVETTRRGISPGHMTKPRKTTEE